MIEWEAILEENKNLSQTKIAKKLGIRSATVSAACRRLGVHLPRESKMITRICETCGKEFKVYPSYLRRARSAFCSRACQYRRMRGENHHRWKNPRIINCQQCGKPFGVKTKKMRKYCSQKCWGEAERIFRLGKRNPAWRGGVSDEGQRIRNSIQGRLWREAVFARDNWTCQKCGERGYELEAHHLKSFAEYQELRFAIDNGQTLCYDCHRGEDKEKRGG